MLVAGLEGQPEPARVKRGPRDEGRAQQHGLRQHGLSPHDKLPIRAQAGRLWGAPWITFTARVDHRGPWSLVELGVDCRRLLGVGCESARLIVWGRMKVGLCWIITSQCRHMTTQNPTAAPRTQLINLRRALEALDAGERGATASAGLCRPQSRSASSRGPKGGRQSARPTWRAASPRLPRKKRLKVPTLP